MSESVGKAGRPRQFRNDAEKQKAYREREKADQQQMEHALWLLNQVQEKEQSLRNLLMYWTAKRGDAVLEVSTLSEWAHILVNGSFTNTVHWIVAQSMLRRGELELVRRNFGSNYYKLRGDKS